MTAESLALAPSLLPDSKHLRSQIRFLPFPCKTLHWGTKFTLICSWEKVSWCLSIEAFSCLALSAWWLSFILPNCVSSLTGYWVPGTSLVLVPTSTVGAFAAFVSDLENGFPGISLSGWWSLGRSRGEWCLCRNRVPSHTCCPFVSSLSVTETYLIH